ncbi:MAG TPA: tyrosine-type recombinase/integrase [Egibacteraceae bacterium]|nr:tyrosine-type recombinase/integrase [Egibacteraceae bacterium]
MAKKRARRHHGGSIRALTSGRWQVRVHDRATGRHVTLGTFPTKEDANAALSAAVADQNRGKWVTPQRGQVPLAAYCQQWIDEHTGLGPRTRDTYQSILDRHVAPHLGESHLGHLTTATVRRWHTKLHKEASPSAAAKAYRLLRAVCNTAVEDGVLAVNPCQVKGAGVERPDERPIATVAEVQALADAVPPRYRALVLLAAWCSLRLGELTALTRADLDLLHGKVKVTKNLQRLDDGTLVVVKPKSEAGRRTVTIPPPLLPDVKAHLDAYVGVARDALVFTNERGRPIHRHRWSDIWRRARLTVGRPDLRFHDLRHTGNTLAAATGASTAELMARMGHNSPRAALIYQHATQDRDEAIAHALGELIKPAPVTGLDDHRDTP